MEDKKGLGMIWLLVVLGLSWVVFALWDKYPVIKQTVDSVLDPTFGALLKINVYLGFAAIIAFTSLILTLAQKYLSDQEQLREMKKEQKFLQEEMKKYREHPEKLLELQKKQLEFFPRTMELTTKPLLFTTIPIILFFRWFGNYLEPIFGGWWILYYILGSLIFSSIFRKLLNVA
ncbi:MAG: EMC3/TMCO1 family protein [Candidatus Pacearchaeota archaeon]